MRCPLPLPAHDMSHQQRSESTRQVHGILMCSKWPIPHIDLYEFPVASQGHYIGETTLPHGTCCRNIPVQPMYHSCKSSNM